MEQICSRERDKSEWISMNRNVYVKLDHLNAVIDQLLRKNHLGIVFKVLMFHSWKSY